MKPDLYRFTSKRDTYYCVFKSICKAEEPFKAESLIKIKFLRLYLRKLLLEFNQETQFC